MSSASSLQLSLENVQMNNYSALVILIAVGYDYLLTFPDEIEYIWSKPWTRVSTLFVLARYFGLCCATINALMGCTFLPGPEKVISREMLDIFYFWASFLFMSSAELSMILRVWALYIRSKLVLSALLAIYIVEVILYFVLCIMVSTREMPTVIVPQVLDFSTCVIEFHAPTWTICVCSAQIVLGSLMCSLIIVQLGKEVVRMYKQRHVRVSRYTKLLVREGMVYFLAILTYAVINMQVYQGSVSLGGWQVIVLAIVASIFPYTLVPRFILNLRELYARDQQGRCEAIDTAFGLASAHGRDAAVSAIVFAEGTPQTSELQEEIQMGERESGGTGSNSATTL